MTKKQNTSSPKESAENTRKRKRVIPTRQPGAIINPIYNNPADDLFAEAFGNKAENTGHPVQKILDTHLENIKTPSNKITGHSTDTLLDTQPLKIQTPSTENTGHPSPKILDTFAPSITDDAPSKGKNSGAKTPSKKQTGHSRNENWKAWEKTRSTIRVNLHIDKELDKKVRRYCLESDPRVELREFYERAAVLLLDTQSGKELGAFAPLDDRRLRTLYKTKPSIIHLYSAYAENSRWSANDDAKASALNDVDLRIVELGILQTLGNRKTKGKINSFGYFLPEIENFLEIEMPEEGIEAMLTINRKSFQRLTGKTIDLSFLNEPAE